MIWQRRRSGDIISIKIAATALPGGDGLIGGGALD